MSFPIHSLFGYHIAMPFAPSHPPVGAGAIYPEGHTGFRVSVEESPGDLTTAPGQSVEEVRGRNDVHTSVDCIAYI